MPVAEQAGLELLSLPVYPEVTEAQQRHSSKSCWRRSRAPEGGALQGRMLWSRRGGLQCRAIARTGSGQAAQSAKSTTVR
jgi:hypothetical protein